ncbi:MAG: phage tail sheath subtilisin-like domain-containing protein [Byssovorax sp.]
MSFAPGVYLEEIPRVPSAPLGTGIPAFLGVQGISDVVRLEIFHDLSLTGFDDATRFAVRGFFANGGRRCYLVPSEPGGGFNGTIDRLDPFEEIDLVCAPGLVALYPTARGLAGAQANLVASAARSGRLFAILDTLADATQLEAHRTSLRRLLEASRVSSFAALYFPWIKVQGACATCAGTGLGASGRTCSTCSGSTLGAVPPSGHLAGIYARTDHRVGVFGAPANTVVAGAVDLSSRITSAESADLDDAGINGLRSFPGRGIRVWGARTLSRDPSYRYINVRRLMITLARWIEHATLDLVFEPQSPLLWLRLGRQMSSLLQALFERGALVGKTPLEAYYVKCDEETNPPDVRARGQVVAEIGVAPARPGEFIRLSVIQGERGVTTTERG